MKKRIKVTVWGPKKSRSVEILNHQMVYQWVWLSGPTFISSFAFGNSKAHQSHPSSKPHLVWLALTEVRRLKSAQKYLQQLVHSSSVPMLGTQTKPSCSLGVPAPNGTHLNATNPPQKSILFAGLAKICELLNLCNQWPLFPFTSPNIYCNTGWAPSWPQQSLFLWGTEPPNLMPRAAKMVPKPRKAPLPGTSLLHFPTWASSFLKS